MGFKKTDHDRVQYAVVAMGHIAQNAILPAFANATENSELAAIMSGDEDKRNELSDRLGVPAFRYNEYDEMLAEVDAVFLALPNSMHHDFTIRAAEAGVHILCEKPMAVTVAECEEMIEAADDNEVKLMIAYRLHFDEPNLEAIRIAQSGELGDLKMFHSVFSQQVKPDNIRLNRALGGGPLSDIGIYSINAARALFRSEPLEVSAMSTSSDDPRFSEVPEIVGGVLRFPDNRLATILSSFGAASVSMFEIVGTKGSLRLDPAFDYQAPLRHQLSVDGVVREKEFPKRDQFAAEIHYFSECILQNRKPEPCGREGLADMRVIEALHESAFTHTPVVLEPFPKQDRPSLQQEIHFPPSHPEPLVKVEAPSF